MKQGIIIPTHVSRLRWLDQCLKSIQTTYPVYVVFQGEEPDPEVCQLIREKGFLPCHQELNGYDPGGIVYAMHHTELDEFFILHDSCIVKDNKLFDKVFHKDHKSIALSLTPCPFGMFLGKYQRSVCEMMEIPVAHNKYHAVELEESWNREYSAKAQWELLFDDFHDQQVFEEKFGRTNMVLENKYLKKWKGSWHRDMVK